MLSGLRQGTPIYVLYKNDLKVAVGEVVSVSNPMPLFGTTTYNAGVLMPPKTVVDVKARIGTDTVDFQKLPAEQVIADFGANGVVVSESREAILNEIDGFKKISERALSEEDRHREVVAACDRMTAELNPQVRKEAETTAEIANIKRGMSDLRDDLADIKALLAKSLNRAAKTKEE